MSLPFQPKLYHIIHKDNLLSVVHSDGLFCDAKMQSQSGLKTIIGISEIKRRRSELQLRSHPGLHVGECVPFYFCPRSVMLYVIAQKNHPDLAYHGGQTPIVHLEADLYATISWATSNGKRWAFTSSNAGSYYFEDYCTTANLNAIDWDAVRARDWRNCKEAKQAEFLLEGFFPWSLVERIGVMNQDVSQSVIYAIAPAKHKPPVSVILDWYY